MKKTYCDWCGRFIKIYWSDSNIIKISGSLEEEICKECSKQFKTLRKTIKNDRI